jgi:MFS family permease
MTAARDEAIVQSKAGVFSATTGVLVLICLMYGLTYIDRNNVSTAATVFGKDLHLTNTQVGLIYSAFAYPYLVFQIIGGWVSDRFGARFGLTVFGLIWALATLFTGLATSLFAVVALRVMLGFGEGATFPTATRVMSDWTAKGRRAYAQGITHASARLGNAITPPLVAWLIVAVTWRGSFIVLGIISLLWVILWGVYFRDDPGAHPHITPRELEYLPNYAAQLKRKREPVPWKALTRRMVPVTFVYFCYGWTLWLYLAWIPSFFLHNYKMKLTDSALFSAGVFFAGVVGNMLGGVMSDRVYEKTNDRNKARRNLVVFGFLCSLVVTLPILATHNLSLVAICLSLAFFFTEFTIGPMWAIPMDIAPRFSGSASGLMNTGSAFAAIVSPLLFGYIVDKTGNWGLPFIGNIVLLLLGAIVAFWMKPEEELAGCDLDEVTGVTPKTV